MLLKIDRIARVINDNGHFCILIRSSSHLVNSEAGTGTTSLIGGVKRLCLKTKFALQGTVSCPGVPSTPEIGS